jgi:hypothetical protein
MSLVQQGDFMWALVSSLNPVTWQGYPPDLFKTARQALGPVMNCAASVMALFSP